MESMRKGGKGVKKVCGFKVLMFNMFAGPDDDDIDEYYDTRIPIDLKKIQNEVVMDEKRTLVDELLECYQSSDDSNKKRLIIVIKLIVPKLLKNFRGNHAIMELVDTTKVVGSESLVLKQFRQQIVEEIKEEKLRWERIDVLRSVLEMMPEFEDNSEKSNIDDAIKWGERLRRRQIFLVKLDKDRKTTDPKAEFVTPPSDTWDRWCEGLYFAKEDEDNAQLPEQLPSKKFLMEQSDFHGNPMEVSHTVCDVISFIEKGESREERRETMIAALGHVKEYLRGCTHVTVGLSWTMQMAIYVRYGDWAFVPEMKILRKGYKGDFPVGKVSEEAYWVLAVLYYDSNENDSGDESTSS